jgi:hypothetical protein
MTAALLRSELLKASSGRAAPTLALAALVLTAASIAGTASRTTSDLTAASPELAGVTTDLLRLGFGTLLFTAIFGALSVTAETRHGTLPLTLAAGAGRNRVALAKALVATGFGLVLGVMSVIMSIVVTAVALRADILPLRLGREDALTLFGVVLVNVLAGAWGVAVGWLVGNQVAAVLGIAAYTLLLEGAIVEFVPSVGRWLPGGAQSAIIREPGDFVAMPWGVALFLAWLALAWTAVHLVLRRRDITL